MIVSFKLTQISTVESDQGTTFQPANLYSHNADLDCELPSAEGVEYFLELLGHWK